MPRLPMQVQSKCSSATSIVKHRPISFYRRRLPVAAKTCVAKLCRAEERTTEGLIPGFFLGARSCFHGYKVPGFRL